MSFLVQSRSESTLAHVHPDRKCVVRRGLPSDQEILSRERLDSGALMQDEMREGLHRDGNLEIDAGHLPPSEPGEVEIKSDELVGGVELVLDFLAQFAPERLERLLAGVHRAARAAPVLGI